MSDDSARPRRWESSEDDPAVKIHLERYNAILEEQERKRQAVQVLQAQIQGLEGARAERLRMLGEIVGVPTDEDTTSKMRVEDGRVIFEEVELG